MFNPHHLELFYYVARYGGISAAARHLPYGIGQPAISGQMADLERQVGARLFERRPFQLTEQGKLIYAHIGLYYDGLGRLWQQVRDPAARIVRIAAADTLGHELLSPIIDATAPLSPGTRFELLTGRPAELAAWVLERRVQLAITPVDRRVRRVCSLVLAQMGMQLLVRRKTKIRSPGYFWGQADITEPLICPPEADPVYQCFERGLQSLHVKWLAGISVFIRAIRAQTALLRLGRAPLLAGALRPYRFTLSSRPQLSLSCIWCVVRSVASLGTWCPSPFALRSFTL